MSSMGLWDVSEAVRKALPGSVKSMNVNEGEGAVASVVHDDEEDRECFVVSYIRIEDDGARLMVTVRYQKSATDPFEAGVEYRKLEEMMPVRHKERPPEGADPVEELAFEADAQKAFTDIVRMQVAIENHPDLEADEIIARRLDRPPDERPL